jgi:hypothetical protein
MGLEHGPHGAVDHEDALAQEPGQKSQPPAPPLLRRFADPPIRQGGTILPNEKKPGA